MRRDIETALSESGCSVDAVTTALQIVAQVYRVRASEMRPWLAGVRHDGSCVVAVDARRETVLIECDAFGASVAGTIETLWKHGRNGMKTEALSAALERIGV